MAATISNPAPIGRKSSAELIGRNGGGMAVCEKVLKTPLTAECRTRQTCGIFTSIGFQWPGSVIVEQQPAMAKASGRLLAVFKYLAAPLNKGRSLNELKGNPMNTPSQGAIRPQSVPAPYRPTCETLQGVLAELEAAADLVEHLLTHGTDDATLATVKASLGELVSIMNGGR